VSALYSGKSPGKNPKDQGAIDLIMFSVPLEEREEARNLIAQEILPLLEAWIEASATDHLTRSVSFLRLSPLARKPDCSFPTAPPECPPFAGEFSQRRAYSQSQPMRSLVQAGGFDRLMDSGFEGQEPRIQPRKPTDAQQIGLGQNEDSRNQSSSGDLGGNGNHQPQHCVTVGDEIERGQLYGNQQ
jgi:hypothetical protein